MTSLHRPSPATLIALLALFVALGGPAEARKLINGKLIRKGTVRSAQIKDRSLTTRDLSSAAVRQLMATPARSVGPDQLLPAAVTGDKLAAFSVSSLAVNDESLTAADLAPNAVGNSELATNAVTASKIASGAVGKSEIRGSAVGTEEVIDGGLTDKDVGAFAGTFEHPLGALAPQACDSFDQAVTPVGADQDVTNDVVVVTPGAAFPDTLSVTARPTAAATIRVSICNVGGAATLPVTPLAFRYVSFGGT